MYSICCGYLPSCLEGLPDNVSISLASPWTSQVQGNFVTLTTPSYVNACWVLGQLIASIVMRSMIDNTTAWSYRIPFALQWIFPIPISFAVWFAPESPWWLIRQNRFEDARATLRRLRTKPATISDDEFATTLRGAMETMIQTNEREKKMQSGTSYKDCFNGVDKRRTEITCMAWTIQTLCGSTFMGFSTYFCKSPDLCTPPPHV
jgi:SP family general alpha glucoside:H+ symporter-like MFS transporter